MALSDKELAAMYLKYHKEKKLYKDRTSLYDLNKYLELKKALALIKMEMYKRGLNKKEAKKLCHQ